MSLSADPGIEPRFAKPAPKESSGGVLGMTALFVLLVELLLQVWRPYYHLTDDNLSCFYPVAKEMCESLWSGQPITVNRHLFGGDYSLRNDIASIGLWSPWLFLVSRLGISAHHAWLVEAMSLGNSVTIALAFAGSMLFLRRRVEWAASDRVIVVASLSFTFTPFNLLAASSWVGFLNAQAVLPVALAAAHARRWWLAALPVAAAWIFGLLGGHLHPTLMAMAFGGLLMILVAWHRRSWTPLWTFGAGGMLAMLMLSPLLAPGFAGFGHAARSAGISADLLTAARVSPATLIPSVLLGPVVSAWTEAVPLSESQTVFGTGIAFSLVSLPALVAVGLAARRRRFDGLSVGLIGMFLAAALWIVKPAWLAEIQAHLPLFKSLRWSLREIAVLLFPLHALFVRHAAELATLRPVLRPLPAVAGLTSLFVLVLGLPPTFNAFAVDRSLMFSGETRHYWEQIRREAALPVRIVIGAPRALLEKKWKYFPFSALGAFNFASLYGIVNVSGFSITTPPLAGFPGLVPHTGSIFVEEDARLIHSRTPGTTLVFMESVDPMRWTIEPPPPVARRSYRVDLDTGRIVEEQPPVSAEPQGSGPP